MSRLLSVSTQGHSALLVCWLILLLAIPSNRVFTAMGSLGTPQILGGLGLLLLWGTSRIHGSVSFGGGAVSAAVWIWAFVMGLGLIAAFRRPLHGTEATQSIAMAIAVVSWCGLVTYVSNSVPDISAVDHLVSWFVGLASVLGMIGLAQYVTGQILVDRLSFPLLSVNGDLKTTLVERSGVLRAQGTATHPLEYGSILAMALPFAVDKAFNTQGNKIARWLPVVIIGASAITSVSRSTLICASLAIFAVWIGMPPAQKLILAALAFVSGAAALVAVPSIARALLGLFVGIAQDGSAASRSDSYALAFEFIARSPWLGRGFGTFQPPYRVLDNAYLGLLIEVGAIGLLSFLAVLAVSILVSIKVMRAGDRFRGLGAASLGALLAGGTALALYDGLGFMMGASTTFFAIGMAGALRRIQRESEAATAGSD